MKEEAQDLKYGRPSEPLYIACLEMNFDWLQSEVKYAIREWNKGLPVRETIENVAKKFERDPDEVMLLFISLAREKKIKPRG